MPEGPSSERCLAVYVTSHGYGHLNRTVAVLNQIPADVPVRIRCDPNLFGGWKERLTRPAELEGYVSDAGAVNPPGDSAATDGPATLARARARHAASVAELGREVELLGSMGAAAVLADAPPLPLVAARRAGIPGFALANFTWSEIYDEHAQALGDPGSRAFVEELRRSYATATLSFRAQPSLPMAEFPRMVDVGLVVTAGHDRSAELRRHLGLEPGAKLVYFYVGRYGQDNLDYRALASLAPVHFVGFHPAPASAGAVPNLHVVSPAEWTGTDLMASTDAAVAKAGYGSVSEAMAARTPLLYPPRTGFAEHQALVRGLNDWGAGFEIPPERFARFDIERELSRALGLDPVPPAPFAADGAARVAEHLTRVCRERLAPRA